MARGRTQRRTAMVRGTGVAKKMKQKADKKDDKAMIAEREYGRRSTTPRSAARRSTATAAKRTTACAGPWPQTRVRGEASGPCLGLAKRARARRSVAGSRRPASGPHVERFDEGGGRGAMSGEKRALTRPRRDHSAVACRPEAKEPHCDHRATWRRWAARASGEASGGYRASAPSDALDPASFCDSPRPALRAIEASKVPPA